MKEIIQVNELKLLAKKLVDYTFKADDFFWEEDACCPAMNDAQLDAAAKKSTRIHTTLNFVSSRLGVKQGEVIRVMNQMTSPRSNPEQLEAIVAKTYVERRIASKLHEHQVKREMEFNSSISPYWGEQAKKYNATLVRNELNKPVAFRLKDGSQIKIDIENNI